MIYFTQDSFSLNIKIGFVESDAPTAAEARRRQLQTGNSSALIVLATMPGDRKKESELHEKFAQHRVGGEWFKPVPEVLAEAYAAARRE